MNNRVFKIIILQLLFFIGQLAAVDWQIDKNSENKVVFQSSTTLLDFNGSTSQIDGYIYWEGEQFLGDKNELYFEVQPATFETGIGKRDRDMREDVLHTGKFPVASFKGHIVKVEKNGAEYSVLVKGEMSLHGHKKSIDLPGVITLKDTNMNVRSDFSIYLKDFKIEAPSLAAFIKVAEEIKLSVDFNLIKAE